MGRDHTLEDRRRAAVVSSEPSQLTARLECEVSNMVAANDAAEAAPALVFLSKAQVLKKIPITAPTLWAWVRAGKFPRPRAISDNKTVWVEAEVDAWMQSRPLRTYKAP
jgi:prophage regulatory protein